MPVEIVTSANVKQAVPFFGVTNMEASLRFYVDGLGFKMKRWWIPDEAQGDYKPDGRIRWCWLELGDAALMLQEFWKEGPDTWVPQEKLGVGVNICFQCLDALAIYSEVTSRGIAAKKPFVGNGMWVTSLQDPDGYRLDFESPTDVPEGTEYSEQAS